jgi:hypothetical protein
MDTRLFTPRQSEHIERRARMQISMVDADKIGRGGPWEATVTDQNTSRTYRVRGAACELRTATVTRLSSARSLEA